MNPIRRVLGMAVATVMSTALLACGDSETSTVAEAETVSASTSSTEESTSESTTTTTTTFDGAEGPPEADLEVVKLTGFTSPSGNIGCLIDRRSVRCDIEERAWEPPPAPKSCKLDYGQGISLAAGGSADFVCAGDTALGDGGPLPDGESIAAGLLRCESAEDGISCRDLESGRGFTIAQESFELF